MSSIGAAPGATLSPARAAASRINGARSRGPKTPAGKARSARNALKHGLRAERFVLVGDEDEADYAAHAQALMDQLAPADALQHLLARRIAAAAWRLERAERIETELFAIQGEGGPPRWGRLGLALIRDGNGAGAFNTLLRYRAAAEAQLWRALRTLEALQAAAAPRPAAVPNEPEARPDTAPETPNGPETHADAGTAGATTRTLRTAPVGDAGRAGRRDADAADPGAAPARAAQPPVCRIHPKEPEARGKPDPTRHATRPPADAGTVDSARAEAGRGPAPQRPGCPGAPGGAAQASCVGGTRGTQASDGPGGGSA